MDAKLEFIINHIFLPPQRPQSDDNSLENTTYLVKTVLAALQLFHDHHLPAAQTSEWIHCIQMLSNLANIQQGGGCLDASQVEVSLRDLSDNGILAFHLRAQNAGLLIRRMGPDYSFEALELAPTNIATMETIGRLIRAFPEPGVSITQSILNDSHFLTPFAEMLENLDAQAVEEMLPTTTKADSAVRETRETTSPLLVTKMLTQMLMAIGKPNTNANRFYKHTREDVLWNNANLPWRRSPLWLLVRVALQVGLQNSQDANSPHRRYKSFMIFLHAFIARETLKQATPSDLLFILNAKITRRVLKITLADSSPGATYVKATIDLVKSELERRWAAAQDSPLLKPLPVDLPVHEHIALRLATLKPYLEGIKDRKADNAPSAEYNPNCAKRISQTSDTLPDLGIFSDLDEEGIELPLNDLEYWVECHLDNWTARHLHNSEAFLNLATVVEKYISSAPSQFNNKPEQLSLMYLTIMEMWVAMDKYAIRVYPLLKKYSPGFRVEVLEPLLLPKKSHMERIKKVEEYIVHSRTPASGHDAHYLFAETNSAESISVQYFDSSYSLQELKKKIEVEAQAKREEIAEFLAKELEYHYLIEDSNSRSHEDHSIWPYGKFDTIHDSDRCRKCCLVSQAKALTFQEHEWPLPKDALAAKAVVFELAMPQPLSQWRALTFRIHLDILSPSANIKESSLQGLHLLKNYSPLIPYRECSTTSLHLVSITKPFISTHYSAPRVADANVNMVSLNNGQSFAMFDLDTKHWTIDCLGHTNIRDRCTPKLPPEFSSLQFAITSTEHSSNDVIARQNQCPATLSVQEFYNIGSLRAGYRLQWSNIARELIAGTLNFNSETVNILFTQAAWQAGPLGDSVTTSRESHTDLEEEEYCISLLQALSIQTSEIEENWQGAVSLRTFVILAARILTMAASVTVREVCMSYLHKARCIAFKWTRILREKLQHAKSDRERASLSILSLEMGLTCLSTYDLDRTDLSLLLGSNTKNCAMLIECLITVHDRIPPSVSSIPPPIHRLLHLQRRLTHLLEPLIREQMIKNPTGINETIAMLWAGYNPSEEWTTLRAPLERWITTKTTPLDNSLPAIVHFNLLNGALLVNGLSLTRLPRDYEQHATFQRLFGNRVFDVLPSPFPHIDFESRDRLQGYRILFRMNQSNLIIELHGKQSYEVIPKHAVEGDFPEAFAEKFVHLLNLKTKEVEFRQLSKDWIVSKPRWLLQTEQTDTSTLNNKIDALSLLDIHSPASIAIHEMLCSLEEARYIHVMLERGGSAGNIRVHLPRYRLDFMWLGGTTQLASKQCRGMVVDLTQSFGAMVGLVNKLVLCSANNNCSVTDTTFIHSVRSVIIPHGSVQFARSSHHIVVEILRSKPLVQYHIFGIDPLLGQLTDDSSLKVKLYKSYLHAVTSHCLLDPLIGRTGTEEALSILGSASVLSHQQLEDDEMELLTILAKLTPHREYYPTYLKTMQQTWWGKLSPLSQHTLFLTRVLRIIKCTNNYVKVYGKSCKVRGTSKMRSNSHLLERAAIRESAFQVSGFGAELQTTAKDAQYNVRGMTDESKSVFYIAQLAAAWSTELQCAPQLLNTLISWQKPIGDEGNSHNQFVLGYDPEWLGPPQSFLPSIWCRLQIMLSKSNKEKDKYRLMMFLATMAFSSHADDFPTETLLAFATVPAFRNIRPPEYSLFELPRGFQIVKRELVDTIKEEANNYSQFPEFRNSRQLYESYQQYEERLSILCKNALDTWATKYANELINQWPSETIDIPADSEFDAYLSFPAAAHKSRALLKTWFVNLQFMNYIKSIEVSLASLSSGPRTAFPPIASMAYHMPSTARSYLNIADILKTPPPTSLPSNNLPSLVGFVKSQNGDTSGNERFKILLAELLTAPSDSHELDYALRLQESFQAAPYTPNFRLTEENVDLSFLLQHNVVTHLRRLEDIQCKIMESLRAETMFCCQLAHTGGLIPRLSTISLLALISNNHPALLTPAWKECLIAYALSIANFQRAQRMYSARGNKAELAAELSNPGHENWHPLDHPDWLLFEIEQNLTIRPVQIQIAQEMINPSSGTNSVMQLNMGEGKSSVIVPIIAASLADQSKLVRVIVLKPLSSQMFRLLITKLAGLLGRQIYHMPFSRSIKVDSEKARALSDLCKECMSSRGIFLVQPEHILSFELMAAEQTITDNSELGNSLTATQRWLNNNSRDILDESDEILSVRYELVYSMGTQTAYEHAPDRWHLIQEVLKISAAAIKILHTQLPQSFEYQPHPIGGFPRLRVLTSAASTVLVIRVAQEICDNGLPGLAVWHLPAHLRKLLFDALTDAQATTNNTLGPLWDHPFTTPHVEKTILLLRGLLAHNVLRHVLAAKRWRVSYGLDRSRTLLAVPYRAKDVPATRAEFSQPDVAIALTCLSYYYGCLSDKELLAALAALARTDQAATSYARWAFDAPTLAPAFRQLAGVNLSDTVKCQENVFPALRFAKSAIDFYLSHLVFPRAARTFPQKLSSSGWNLTRTKTHPTTGFSGTSDARFVLPLSIAQADLSAQAHTNAGVLCTLLREENEFVSGATFDSAEKLLALAVATPGVRVILDAGALVLEWTNHQLAYQWLQQTSDVDVDAAVFFEGDELSVMTRGGQVEALQASPFATQLDRCVVYLDEAHTRGTDLKMPTGWRGLVTLGPRVSKDRLVQTCMRMRKLGRGHAVTICASHDVLAQIKQLQLQQRNSDNNAVASPVPLGVIDIIRWAIAQSTSHTHRCVPLWATQGARYLRHQAVWDNSTISSSDTTDGESPLTNAEALLESDALSLMERYGWPSSATTTYSQGADLQPLTPGNATMMRDIEQRLSAFGCDAPLSSSSSFGLAALYEEQERELAPEAEREEQRELPPPP